MSEYTIVLTPDDELQVYAVTVPALPGCVTQGRTVEECIERAREAIECHIAAMLASGESVPVEKRPAQTAKVRVAA